MAFPSSPSDGQIYKNYKYNSTKGAWIYSPYINYDASGNVIITPESGERIVFDGGTNLRYYFKNVGLDHGTTLSTSGITLSGYSKTFTAHANRKYKINVACGIKGATDGGYLRYALIYVNVNSSVKAMGIQGMNMNSSSNPSWYFILHANVIVGDFNEGDSVNVTVTSRMGDAASGTWMTYNPDSENPGHIEIIELPVVDTL